MAICLHGAIGMSLTERVSMGTFCWGLQANAGLLLYPLGRLLLPCSCAGLQGQCWGLGSTLLGVAQAQVALLQILKLGQQPAPASPATLRSHIRK